MTASVASLAHRSSALFQHLATASARRDSLRLVRRARWWLQRGCSCAGAVGA
jgi:hypothetical protein